MLPKYSIEIQPISFTGPIKIPTIYFLVIRVDELYFYLNKFFTEVSTYESTSNI